MRTILVVVNGEFSHEGRLAQVLTQADYVIAADGGANWLDAQACQPDLLIGDMDSVRPGLLVDLEQRDCIIERHPTHKDETDMELALLAAAEKVVELETVGQAARIVVLGALGGRIDHELANVMLLTMPQLAQISVAIYDGVSHMMLIRKEIEIVGQSGDLVSLVPLGGEVCGITTCGLEYPLRNEPLFIGPARGVSNVLLGERARVRLTEGMLLVIHTPLANLEETDA